MTEFSDQYLLSKIAEKDLRSFELLMCRYEEKVYNFVLKLVKLPELAEEITQDAFISIWEGGRRLSDIRSVGAWLYSVSRNQSLNVLKQMAARYLREEHYAASQPQVSEEDINAREYKSLLFSFAGQLPPKRREIFLLKIEKGLTNEEIGSYLSISPNTVKNQLQKSYFTIRKLIAESAIIILLYASLR